MEDKDLIAMIRRVGEPDLHCSGFEKAHENVEFNAIRVANIVFEVELHFFGVQVRKNYGCRTRRRAYICRTYRLGTTITKEADIFDRSRIGKRKIFSGDVASLWIPAHADEAQIIKSGKGRVLFS